MSPLMTPSAADAVAYVLNHFASRDYGFTVAATEVIVAADGAADVAFYSANDPEPQGIMSVWYEGGALYGEW